MSASRPHKLPIQVDFVAYRGDDWTRMFEPVYRDASTGEMQALDMTGWTGRMQIRESSALDSPLLLEVTSDNSQIITGPQSGGGRTWQLLVYLSAANTRSLPPGLVAYYDIELTKADGKRQTMYYGSFCVEGDISK